MKQICRKRLLSVMATIGLLMFGVGPALAAHPNIPLYTYEEVASQFGQPVMPVALDADYKGFPYSPKATCGNCHNGGLLRNDGYGSITDADGSEITEPLVSYADMNSNTFHAQMDAGNMVETSGVSAQGGKPWTQSLGMAGKW